MCNSHFLRVSIQWSITIKKWCLQNAYAVVDRLPSSKGEQGRGEGLGSSRRTRKSEAKPGPKIPRPSSVRAPAPSTCDMEAAGSGSCATRLRRLVRDRRVCVKGGVEPHEEDDALGQDEFILAHQPVEAGPQRLIERMRPAVSDLMADRFGDDRGFGGAGLPSALVDDDIVAQAVRLPHSANSVRGIACRENFHQSQEAHHRFGFLPRRARECTIWRPPEGPSSWRSRQISSGRT